MTNYSNPRVHGAGMVSIMRGDMKYQHEIAHYPNPRYTELMELLKPVEPMVNLIAVGPNEERLDE